MCDSFKINVRIFFPFSSAFLLTFFVVVRYHLHFICLNLHFHSPRDLVKK